jgi:glycerophosphoryl diester phosphodiesterase
MRSSGPVRIAHAYGNTRHAIDLALDAEVDMLEADVWYRRRRIFVHHDRHLAPLPLLADRKMRGHPLPPWSLPLPRRYYVRPDIHILTLEGLLDRTAGRRRLLLDVKGNNDAGYARRFARRLASAIRKAQATNGVEVCGQTWPVLTELRELAPEIAVRFSIERPDQWQEFVLKAKRAGRAPDVCIQHRFLTDDRLRFLKDHGAGIYTWTVDTVPEARALLDRGIDGIISNNLDLLAILGSGADD